MKDHERETRFLNRVRSELDREADNLDVETTNRLRRIRHSALEQLDTARFDWRRQLRLPAIALATGAIIAAVVLTDYRSARLLPDRQTVADLEILASDDHLDLFDDLEFYSWLAETEDHAS